MIKTAFQIKGTVGIFLRVVMNVNEKKEVDAKHLLFYTR